MPRMERDPHSHSLIFHKTPEEEAFENLEKSHSNLLEEHVNLKNELEELKKAVKSLSNSHPKKNNKN